MTINGKRDHFVIDDFEAVAKNIRLATWRDIVDEVVEGVGQWLHVAEQAGVSPAHATQIQSTLRTETICASAHRLFVDMGDSGPRF